MNRKRGPGSTGSRAGGSGGSPGKKRGTGPGSGGGKNGPTSKSTGAGAKTEPGAFNPRGSGPRKGTWTGPKSGTKKSPRGTTGPVGILRKRPATNAGTGPDRAGTTASGKTGGKKGKVRSGKAGAGPASVPRAPGGKSRKGKKIPLTPGITHGTFAATDKYDCRCRKCRRFQKEYDRKVLGAMKFAAQGRTTLGEAVHETAEKRLKRRRKKMSPPVVTKVKVRKAKKTKATKPGPAGPAAKAPTGPAAATPTRRTLWSTAKARARKRARMRSTTPLPRPTPATGSATSPVSPAAPTPTTAIAGATTAAAPLGGGTVIGTGTPRLSPFEAMGMATATSDPARPITVERADSPGSGPAPSDAGLPAASSTKEHSVSDAWLTKWGGSVAGMDAQHETEVTLDDTLNVLEELTQQSFTAHETCRKLSAKARQIRHALDELATDLRSTHNVIGHLTGAAMAKLAESMEVLARKADEMSTKSLVAAELCESTENAMFDAYRPLQQATEDAGLAVPAARIHNEN